MAVLLDTATVPRSDRAEAIDAAMRYATVPNQVTHEDASTVHARIDLWEFGAASLLRQHGSGIRLRRTSTQLRVAAPERISLSLLSPGRWSYTQHRHAQTVDEEQPQLVLTDLTSEFDYIRSGEGGSHSLMVDFEQLSLPVETIRRAASQLACSPVYDLLRTHVAELADIGDRLSEPAKAMVGTASTELVRALIVSAAQDEALERGAMADSLSARITSFVQRHLSDPDLTPARIARAHNISLRQLYNTWSDNDVTLAQWIMLGRLEASRHELAKPDAQHQTIAALARRCGFTDPAHFSRRFREAYGMSPRDWRELQRANPPGVDERERPRAHGRPVD
jgi:AraC-like DNA-binding protein